MYSGNTNGVFWGQDRFRDSKGLKLSMIDNEPTKIKCFSNIMY